MPMIETFWDSTSPMPFSVTFVTVPSVKLITVYKLLPTYTNFHKSTCVFSRRTRTPPTGCIAPEIRVCNGPSCKKEGAQSTIDLINAISSSTTARSTGCLGECGNGPNVIVSSAPISTSKITKNVRTTRSVVHFLQSNACKLDPVALSGIQLKDAADAQLTDGKADNAIALYQKAADTLCRFPSMYVATLCNYSAALIKRGKPFEALDVANQAVDSDSGRAAAWRRKAQAHEACNQIDLAISAWTVVGKLSGTVEETQRHIRKLKRPRIFGL